MSWPELQRRYNDRRSGGAEQDKSNLITDRKRSSLSRRHVNKSVFCQNSIHPPPAFCLYHLSSMATLPNASPAPPAGRFLADEDDGDTASQRSISLSSPANSRPSSAQLNDIPIDDDNNDEAPWSKRASQPLSYRSSEADDVSSLYTHHTKDDNEIESPVTSAAPSVLEDSKDTYTNLPTYPPPKLNGYTHGTDRESIMSFASTSSRKARPESMLVAPPAAGRLILGIALVDFNHLVCHCAYLLNRQPWLIPHL